jgi:hypothetical protein
MAKKSDIVEVPVNEVRKPTAKKNFSLDNFKKKVGAEDVPDKPLRWIKIDDALEQVTGIPGFPMGYVSSCCGFSNSGKSTAVALGIVNAQKMGLLPIIIDLENNLSKYRLTTMGFDWDKEYVFIDNEYLLEHFGKVSDKNRNYASIEDLANCVRFLLREQSDGNLPFDLAFAIDSIGTLNCNKTINAAEKSETDSNFWNAAAYEKEFMYLFNDVIPNSRKITKQYTNTVFVVQKIGRDAMNNTITMKGGRTWEYTPRLQYYFGGIVSKGVKKITATSKKREISYGVSVKVNVLKNQIDGPLGGISMEGSIISVPQGFITPEGIEEYKKKNILYFRNLFGSDDLSADDISTGERIENTEGKLLYDFIDKSE